MLLYSVTWSWSKKHGVRLILATKKGEVSKTEQTFFTSIQRTFINLVSTSHRKVSPRLTTWTIFSINNFCLKIIAFYCIQTLIYPRPPIYNIKEHCQNLDYEVKKDAMKGFGFHSSASSHLKNFLASRKRV